MSIRSSRSLLLASILGVLVVACQADAPRDTADGEPGALLIRPVYEPPPADEPISIGGYGFFAKVDGAEERRVPFEDVLRIEVPDGTHQVTIVTRPQGDTLAPGQQEPEFYDATAECTAEIDVPPGETVEVVYRAIGGATCEILTPEL